MLPCTNEVCFAHISRGPTTSAKVSQTGLHYNHTGPVVPVDTWTYEDCEDNSDDSWSGSDSGSDPLPSVSYSMTVEPRSCQMVDLTVVQVDPNADGVDPVLGVAMIEFGAANCCPRIGFCQERNTQRCRTMGYKSERLLLQEHFSRPMTQPCPRTSGAFPRRVVSSDATTPSRNSAVRNCRHHLRMTAKITLTSMGIPHRRWARLLVALTSILSRACCRP